MTKKTKSDALVIFDFDGVIVDSLPIQFEIYKELAREMNFISSIHDFERQSGTEILSGDIFSVDYRNTLRKVGISTPERIREAERRYLEHISRLRQRIKPFPFIKELLGTLAEDYALAIASNNNENEIKKMLAKSELDRYFSGIFAPPSYPGLKPEPDQLLACMKELRFPTERTAFVGDMDGDIAAAKAAGIKSIAVTWGFHSRKKLEGSDFIAETPEKLIRIVKSIFQRQR